MTMLMWYPVQWWPQSPTQIHTPLGMCSVTNDQNLIDTADIVVFHMLNRSKSVPAKPRPRGALWAYTYWESPGRKPTEIFADFLRAVPGINMLITYESFADVPVPYGFCMTYDGSKLGAGHRAKQTVPSPLHTRSKFSVAIVTNCGSSTRNRRLEELRVLLGRENINLMGTSACADTAFIPQCSRTGRSYKDQFFCFRTLGNIYKFYFALENSDCVDYVSEKIWLNSFYAGMVPIVWGTHTNYSAHLPPKSYINCADFETPSECAAHIRAVASDEALYSSYHAWRDKYWSDNMFYTDQWVQPKALCEYALRNGHQEKANIDVKSLRNDRRLCAYPDSS